MKDLYEVLEVEQTASQEEIKSSYRRLAKKYHPDLNPDNREAEIRFKEISSAYEILGDANKRKEYDMYGETSFYQNSSYGGQGFGSDFFSDIFSDFFSHVYDERHSSKAQYGKDIRYDIDIELRDVLYGVEKEIEIERLQKCENCGGSGAKDKDSVKKCSTCNGTGKVRTKKSSLFGYVIHESICPDCNGSGEVISEKCPDCNGSGFVLKKCKVKINIPKGISEKSILNIKGEGDEGRFGGENGNLHVYINIKPYKNFKRVKDDIYTEVEINYIQAVLGDEIKVENLDGFEKIYIPEGTVHGDVIKIKGKGLPVYRTNLRGDFYVKIKITIPKHLNGEQKESLKEHFKTMGYDYNERKKNIFEKIKEKFE